MNNFQTFDNLYGNLAQTTYPKNPNDFVSHSAKVTYVKFDFSQDTPYDGKVIPGGKYYSDTPSKTDHPDCPIMAWCTYSQILEGGCQTL